MNISICIPTYNRPDLLSKALGSCLDQSLQPFEILIGDDSHNDKTAHLVERIQLTSSIIIRYFHNVPSLKQAGNIKMLFSNVNGDKIVLLHDDDLLLPDALEKLAAGFKEDADVKVVFGKQYIIDEDGSIDLPASEDLNAAYYRTGKFKGSCLTSLEAGFLQQFPNDGYMLDASVLKKVNYRTWSLAVGELGYGSEYDFGVQLGEQDFKMIYIDTYVCKYRRSSGNSISSSSGDDAGLKAFMILKYLNVPPSSYLLKEAFLRNKVPIAISQASKLGKRSQAILLFFSKWHRKKILSPGGIKRLAMLLFPQFFINRPN